MDISRVGGWLLTCKDNEWNGRYFHKYRTRHIYTALLLEIKTDPVVMPWLECARV